MKSRIRLITVSDIFRNRRGSLTFRIILAVFGTALKIFFRRIETVDADRVPKGEGVIFVMNHPNALIDPALVFVALPRRIAFLAKSTLFKMPVIGWVIRSVGALPLYRKIDAGEDVSKNLETFRLCNDLLRRGGSIALFPEGVSHSSPKLLPLKSGASRIALGAAAAGNSAVLIVPVGLYYTNKTTFRSEAMLQFGDPFEVQPTQLDHEGHPPREEVKELTLRIEKGLLDVTLNAETAAELHTARIAEEIFSLADQDLGVEVEFQREFIRDTEETPDPNENLQLENRIYDFESKLDGLGLKPFHLSLARYSRASVFRESVRYAWKLILAFPFALIGAVLHFPAYQLCALAAWAFAGRHSDDAVGNADDVISTVKVIAGVVFMPVTWLITAGIVYYLTRSLWSLLAMPLGFVLGYIALYTLEEFEEAKGWGRAVWIFMTKREQFLRLFVERRGLRKQLAQIDAD